MNTIRWQTADGEIRQCKYVGYTDAQLLDIALKTMEVNPLFISYEIL